jgi:hypothetical protein
MLSAFAALSRHVSIQARLIIIVSHPSHVFPVRTPTNNGSIIHHWLAVLMKVSVR